MANGLPFASDGKTAPLPAFARSKLILSIAADLEEADALGGRAGLMIYIRPGFMALI